MDSAPIVASNRGHARRPAIEPAGDIVDNAHGVAPWAGLAGVPRDDFGISAHDDRLTIEADTRIDTLADLRVRHAEVEVRAPRFARTFTPGAGTTRRESARTCATACSR